MAYQEGFRDVPQTAQPFVALSKSNAPHLQEPIRMTGDTAMRDTSDIISGGDQHLPFDTSDEDEPDSMTDDSSISEERVVSQGLPVAKLPTGLCYDARMRFHSEVSAPTGDSVHPEDPRRILYIYEELREAGLTSDTDDIAPIVDLPLKKIEAREATKEEICLVHTEEHYEFVKSTADMDDETLIELSEHPTMDSIYFNALSYYAGKLSAGGAIETCRAVAAREVKNAIAVIRPPGHHAETSCTMGFCLFNNTCIASRACQEEFGPACRKIFILDWDVHHGNGCQKAFYDDPNILYISLHVHMNGGFYPSGPDGDMYHCGTGLGVGKNVNIPWETKGMGDGDYMYAFQHVVMPIATEFDPDLVIVSAGFDAAAGDELGGCFVSPACYAHMTHMLMSLAHGKVAGGYNFQAISKSALAVTRTLMGEPPDRLTATQATQRGIAVCQKVREIQSNYWRSIYPKDASSGMAIGGERLNDIIRDWQAMNLYNKFRLTELHILRDTISKSFKEQVLASPGYESKRNLLLFFHDPPDLSSKSDPLTNQQRPHDTWMLDASQDYVQSAMNQGFGVIDINIPESITITPVISSDNNNLSASMIQSFIGSKVQYSSQSNDLARKEAEKLAVYLWENYVEPFDFDNIVVLGSGNAFHCVAKLISENETLYTSLTAIISFISEQPVRALSNPNSPWLGQWYREHSLVYVAHDHSLWAREKKSRRYGRTIRAPEDVKGLQRMMLHFKEEVWRFIRETCELDGDGDEGETEEGDDEREEKDVLQGQELVQNQTIGTTLGDGAVKGEAGDGDVRMEEKDDA